MQYSDNISYCATQIINPFFNSRISANHDKGEVFSQLIIKEFTLFDKLITPPSFARIKVKEKTRIFLF